MAAAKSVLIVDDEPLIRLLCIEILGADGFDVTEANGFDMAMDLVDQGVGFDVVLTDVRMAGPRDGIRLANRLRERNDIGAVVLMSGREVDSELGFGSNFLLKPFTATQLRAAAAI